eukprot:747854-Hanusia_phi.AAC.6
MPSRDILRDPSAGGCGGAGEGQDEDKWSAVRFHAISAVTRRKGQGRVSKQGGHSQDCCGREDLSHQLQDMKEEKMEGRRGNEQARWRRGEGG